MQNRKIRLTLFVLVFAITFVSALAWRNLIPVREWLGLTPARYQFRADLTDDKPKEIAKLEEVVKRHPNQSFELNQLADAYVQQAQKTGDVTWYDKAEVLARTSLKLLQSPNPAKMTLAQSLEARHQFDEAIHWAEESMKDRPSSGPLQVITTSYLAKGDYTNANRYADRLVAQKPGADTLLTRGLVRAAQGREDEALFDFKRASQLEDYGDPDGAARLRALWARTLMGRGDFSEAQALLDESLRIRPGNHLALSIRGDLELERGNYKDAQKYLMEAFSNSKQLRYLIHFARAKSLEGDRNGAIEVWQKAETLVRQNLGETNFGHRLDLIEILVDRGDPADLKEAIALSEQEVKNRRNPETLYYFAKALAHSHRYRDAQQVMSDCLSLGEDRRVLRTQRRDRSVIGLPAPSRFLL